MHFRCVDCESPHFLVQWNDTRHLWQCCCEGCGNIYNLLPSGTAEQPIMGVDPTS
jgi:hypothetical protein